MAFVPACATVVLGVDAIVFMSPSTVRGFVSVGRDCRKLRCGTVVASVGPPTTLAAREAGLEGVVEGGDRTMRSEMGR